MNVLENIFSIMNCLYLAFINRSESHIESLQKKLERAKQAYKESVFSTNFDLLKSTCLHVSLDCNKEHLFAELMITIVK